MNDHWSDPWGRPLRSSSWSHRSCELCDISACSGVGPVSPVYELRIRKYTFLVYIILHKGECGNVVEEDVKVTGIVRNALETTTTLWTFELFLKFQGLKVTGDCCPRAFSRKVLEILTQPATKSTPCSGEWWTERSLGYDCFSQLIAARSCCPLICNGHIFHPRLCPSLALLILFASISPQRSLLPNNE